MKFLFDVGIENRTEKSSLLVLKYPNEAVISSKTIFVSDEKQSSY